VAARHAVAILDLSLGGARLAHQMLLRPGSPCYLRVTVCGAVILVPSRVAWSTVVGLGEEPDAPMRFETGLVFDTLPEPARSLLRAYLPASQAHLEAALAAWPEAEP
jgi:hypothetical protein